MLVLRGWNSSSEYLDLKDPPLLGRKRSSALVNKVSFLFGLDEGFYNTLEDISYLN
jgi:hypothetical protein